MEDIVKFFIDFASMEKVPNESDFSQVMSRWRNSSCTHYFALNFSLGNTSISLQYSLHTVCISTILDM